MVTALLAFWIWDLTVMPPGFRHPEFRKASTVALSHEKLHIWIENTIADHAPGSAELERLVPEYARAIETERPIFGDQPKSPSGDRDIHLIIGDIPPYEKHGQKYGFDGFFNVFDQLTEAQAVEQGQHSNERDIVYVNALQDATSDYMKGVVAHELNHLLTSARFDAATNPLDPWVNEMIAESAMQLTGYFTDAKHVEAYRALPEEPLAVDGYGITYGGLSLWAEYLMTLAPSDRLGKLAPAHGDGFERHEAVYGMPWEQLFEGYVQWLFENRSSFLGSSVATRPTQTSYKVAPTGVLYLPAGTAIPAIRAGSAPQSCAASSHFVRSTAVVRHAREPGQQDVTATAVWVESKPPCAASKGGPNFEGFTLE